MINSCSQVNSDMNTLNSAGLSLRQLHSSKLLSKDKKAKRDKEKEYSSSRSSSSNSSSSSSSSIMTRFFKTTMII